jgi:hypothetical protein
MCYHMILLIFCFICYRGVHCSWPMAIKKYLDQTYWASETTVLGEIDGPMTSL